MPIPSTCHALFCCLSFLPVFLFPVHAAITLSYDFSDEDHGWQAGFADYSPATGGMDLDSGHRPRPDDSSRRALYITGNNRSDDLFMFHKKGVKLVAGQWYRIQMSVSFLSNVPPGLVGIGGAPAEGVTVKAGASSVEPVVALEGGHYRMNIDHGQQSNGGSDMQAIGHIGNSGSYNFELVQRNNDGLPAFYARADEEGWLWLIVGTDSGFEGMTELYYTAFEFVLTPVTLTITGSGSQLELSGEMPGVLQESTDLGTWTDLPKATSPWLVSPSEPTKFWRVR